MGEKGKGWDKEIPSTVVKIRNSLERAFCGKHDYCCEVECVLKARDSVERLKRYAGELLDADPYDRDDLGSRYGSPSDSKSKILNLFEIVKTPISQIGFIVAIASVFFSVYLGAYYEHVTLGLGVNLRYPDYLIGPFDHKGLLLVFLIPMVFIGVKMIGPSRGRHELIARKILRRVSTIAQCKRYMKRTPQLYKDDLDQIESALDEGLEAIKRGTDYYWYFAGIILRCPVRPFLSTVVLIGGVFLISVVGIEIFVQASKYTSSSFLHGVADAINRITNPLIGLPVRANSTPILFASMVLAVIPIFVYSATLSYLMYVSYLAIRAHYAHHRSQLFQRVMLFLIFCGAVALSSVYDVGRYLGKNDLKSYQTSFNKSVAITDKSISLGQSVTGTGLHLNDQYKTDVYVISTSDFENEYFLVELYSEAEKRKIAEGLKRRGIHPLLQPTRYLAAIRVPKRHIISLETAQSGATE